MSGQAKTDQDMSGWVRTCQEGNRTGQIGSELVLIGQHKPLEIILALFDFVLICLTLLTLRSYAQILCLLFK